MNMIFIKHYFVGFMVSEIPRESVFGYCPYSVTFPYLICQRYYFILVIYPFIKGNNHLCLQW